MDRRFWFFVLPYSLFVSVTIFLMSGCTELTEDTFQHPQGWADTSSVNFHGKKVESSGIASCASCHGDDYRGGTSGVSCSDCHVGGRSGHPEGFTQPDSSVFHGYIFWENGWDFSSCQNCHGENFEGGVVDFSCSRSWCHASEGGVAACNNCHSDGTEPVFEDVKSHTSTDSVTVGAHTSHIKGSHSLTQAIDCGECHVIPDSLFAEGHLDTTQKVTFSSFVTADGVLQAKWHRDVATCSDVYCHQQTEPKWTKVDGTFSACGSCHSVPPDVGAHFAHVNEVRLDCSTCHDGYSGSDETVSISTHINGNRDITIASDFGGSFNHATESCSEVRCHGIRNSPSWFSTIELSCVSCHGGLEGDTMGAPPYDLSGNSASDALGVGAHQVHLNGGKFSDGVGCGECHTIPDSVLSIGHFDVDLIAEISWGRLATDSSFVEPLWDRQTASCSQTYCHGNFLDETTIGTIRGNDSTFIWTEGESEDYGCGSCHAIPPIGHPDFHITCSVCHSSVVGADTTITEGGKQVHINGRIDYP